MLKTLKYEFRRGAFSLMVMAIIIVAIELYFLIANLLEEYSHAGLALVLMLLASLGCYVFVLINGIVIYSNDLKNKSGYLVFMTPVSSYKIIGAKLLYILLTGFFFVVLTGACIFFDYVSVLSNRDSVVSMTDAFDLILGTFDLSLGGLVVRLISFTLVMLVGFFMTITLAYLAVSICSTAFQAKKGKGILSFLLFVVLYVIIALIADHLPTLGNYGADTTYLEQLYDNLPIYILYVIVMIGSYLGSAALLDKKISL